MTSLVLHFNEPAIAVFGSNTRLRVLMKKRGGKEFLGLRPSYRVSGKNLQLKTVKGEDGKVTSELPAAFIKELKFDRPEHGAAFMLKNIGYGWFILDDMPADATTDLPTVVIADSALIKQAAKAVAAVEKKNEDAAADKQADGATASEAQTDGAGEAEATNTPAPLTDEQKAGAKSSAEELAAHFGIKNEDEVIDGDKTGAITATDKPAETTAAEAAPQEAEATVAPAKKTAAKKSAAASKKGASKTTQPIAKTTATAAKTAKKKPAVKKAAAA